LVSCHTSALLYLIYSLCLLRSTSFHVVETSFQLQTLVCFEFSVFIVYGIASVPSKLTNTISIAIIRQWEFYLSVFRSLSLFINSSRQLFVASMSYVTGPGDRIVDMLQLIRTERSVYRVLDTVTRYNGQFSNCQSWSFITVHGQHKRKEKFRKGMRLKFCRTVHTNAI